MTDLHMFGKLRSKFPNADEAHLVALADVWAIEHDRVICRMLDISLKEYAALPPGVRHEAIFELAKLIHYLEDKIIEKKLTEKSIDEFDPSLERRWLDSPECDQRTENTAKITAEHIWNKFLSEWWNKHPIADNSSKSTKQRKFAKGSVGGVRRQHYSPHFSNKHWADGENKVRIYSRALDGGVRYEDKLAKPWGRDDFLYSQKLEILLSAIESDAGQPYKRLLKMIPFSEDDRRHWVAFLIAQLLRTPSFILSHLPKLRNIIERDGLDYPTDVASLRRAYETLFTNDQVFSYFYKLICGHEWAIWEAPVGHGFLRSDTPVVVTGSLARGNWQLLYPMTPGKCFVSGPVECEIVDVIIPKIRKLDKFEIQKVNSLVASRTQMSAIGQTDRDDTEVCADAFSNRALSGRPVEQGISAYWGKLC